MDVYQLRVLKSLVIFIIVFMLSVIIAINVYKSNKNENLYIFVFSVSIGMAVVSFVFGIVANCYVLLYLCLQN